MKKICFVTTVPITLESFVLPFAKYLHETNEFDISFICDEDENFAASLPKYIHYIPVKMERGISLGGVTAMWKMLRIFKREKFDLVQYSTPNASLYASLASWLAGIKLRKYHLMGFRYLGFDGWKKRIFRRIEKITCFLSTEIECVSPSNLRFGIEQALFPAEKAGVLHYGSSAGVDLSRFDAGKKAVWRAELRKWFGYAEADCVFGFAGRITGDKGINELLAAFEELEEQSAKLFLLGRIENKESLNPELMAAAEKDSRISFHDYVDDVERYYAMMDVLVLPSYREGFGNIIIEAAAMEVPVIVTDIPGPVDAMIHEETGLTIPAKDEDALRVAMERLAQSVEMRKSFGEKGRHLVEERFDQRIITKEALKKLRNCLSAGNRT